MMQKKALQNKMMRMYLKRILFALIAAFCILVGYAAADTLSLPTGTKIIQEEAFCGDEELDEVILPEGIERIEARAFAESGITRIYMPQSLSFIDNDAFDDSDDVMAYGLDGTYAQRWCDLNGIPYEAMVTPLEEFTFEYISDTEASVLGWSGSGNTVIIPQMADEDHEVTVIGVNAFKGKKNLETVFFPSTLKRIERFAFSGDTSLKHLYFPEGLEVICREAFYGCTGLLELNLPESVTELEDTCFGKCTGLTEVTYPINLVSCGTPFSGCTGITKAIIPEGVEKIAPGAFEGLKNLSEIQFPSTLKRIERFAFSGDISLEHLYFPEGLEVICREAFYGCTGLLELNLPESVTELEDTCFGKCTGLTEVTYPINLVSCGTPFSGCTGITKAIIPEGVEEIAPSAFGGLKNLSEIQFPSTLKKIERFAFSGDSSLEHLYFPEGLEVICREAFYGCTGLLELNLPESVTELEDTCFGKCTGLTEVTYPINLVSCGTPFSGCTGITKVIIPEGVEEIAPSAFGGMTGLTEIQFPSTLKTIERFAFSGDSSLEHVILPEGLVTLGRSAFSVCSSLHVIEIPKSVVNFHSWGVFNGAEDFEIWCEYGSHAWEHAINNQFNYYCLTPFGVDFPAVVYQTEGTTLLGSVYSSMELNSIKATLTNQDNGNVLLDREVAPYDYCYPLDLIVSDIDFASLELGHYRLYITASTAKTSEVMLDKYFEVKELPLRLDTMDCSMPANYIGITKKPEMTGTLIANYSMDSITATVTRDEDGALVGTSTAYPESNAFELSELNDNLPALLDYSVYHFTLEVTGHGETVIACSKNIYTLEMMEGIHQGFGRNVDAVFSASLSSNLDELATLSAYFALDCYDPIPGASIADLCSFNNHVVITRHPDVATFTFMWKDFINTNGYYTRLWAIGIKGTEKGQWSDNFNLGSGNYHAGFLNAATTVLQEFVAYQNWINEEHPKPTTDHYLEDKVWVCGHSRGAAAANILGGDLLLEDNNSDGKADFSSSRIYCFCYACPLVTKGSAGSVSHVRVYNILGDIVPRVPLKDWGYKRYGVVKTYDAGSVSTGHGSRIILHGHETDNIETVLSFLPDEATEICRYIASDIEKNKGKNVLMTIVLTILKNGHAIEKVETAAAFAIALNTMDMIYDYLRGAPFEEVIANSHDMYNYYEWLNGEHRITQYSQN